MDMRIPGENQKRKKKGTLTESAFASVAGRNTIGTCTLVYLARQGNTRLKGTHALRTAVTCRGLFLSYRLDQDGCLVPLVGKVSGDIFPPADGSLGGQVPADLFQCACRRFDSETARQ